MRIVCGVNREHNWGRAGVAVWTFWVAAAFVVTTPVFSETVVSPTPGVAAEDLDPLYDDFDESLYGDDDLGEGGEFEEGPYGYPDPIENTNRGVLAFNRQVDHWVLDPITNAYQFVFPKPVRHAISRVFLNLGSTKTLVNDLLQLEWKDAGVTSSRLLINTTIGLVGIFDVAKTFGLERHESDFGQTLALAGTPSGPYMVLPFLGPATVRDGFGTVVDGFFQPTYYFLGPADLLFGPTEIILYGGSSGLSLRERHFEELKALEDSSIDFYAALRSGYYQRRVVEIWGRRSFHRTTEETELNFGGGSDDVLAPDSVLEDSATNAGAVLDGLNEIGSDS